MNQPITIAVLPFKNMSSNMDNEYFCDGLTEEIINALTKIRSLKVTSRTSSFFFKQSNKSLSEIGNELNATIIVDGSVRLSNNKIRISAQLIEVKNDYHFWANSWDKKLEDIFEIQDEISLNIADRIRENFGHLELQEKLVSQQTESIEAYKYFLKGHFYYCKWNQEETLIAIDYFLKAIELDPRHVLSYCWLIECYSFLGGSGYLDQKIALKQAIKYIERALELEFKITEFYTAIASVSFWLEWNIDKTLLNINKAMALNPNYPPGFIIATLAYRQIGQQKIAINYINKAIALDPFSANTLFVKCWILYLAKDYKKSIQFADSALKIDPDFIPAIIIKACSFMKLGLFAEILNLMSANPKIDPVTRSGVLGSTYLLKKNEEKVNEHIQILESLMGKGMDERITIYQIIMNSISGNHDFALNLLEEGIKRKHPSLLLLISDPLLETLVSDPRFKIISGQLIFSKTAYDGSKIIQKQNLLDNTSLDNYTKKLVHYMDIKKPYLEPDMTMRQLAEFIDLHPNKLSWLINEQFNKSFTDFINDYRIEYFKTISKDIEKSNISILGLAFESGFSSKTGFYNSFKKVMSITPKDYIKNRDSE